MYQYFLSINSVQQVIKGLTAYKPETFCNKKSACCLIVKAE